MDYKEFFKISEIKPESDFFNCSDDIICHIAINGGYNGVFHFVQKLYLIINPSNEMKRCHAYVKKQIEDISSIGDYSRLEIHSLAS